MGKKQVNWVRYQSEIDELPAYIALLPTNKRAGG